MQSVSLFWLVTYFVLSFLSVGFVRFAGPLAIGSSYRVEGLDDDEDSGKLNVAYRILAPTICCEVPVFAFVVACESLSIAVPTLRFLPIVFYWVILGLRKQARGLLVGGIVPFLGQALLSLVLTLAFDSFVIGGYIDGLGISVLDNSSIAFQFELALFGVATCWISTLLLRARCYTGDVTSNAPQDESHQYQGPIDVSESRLFSYEKKFGYMLPKRFSSDILLRSLFFAIMAIEDGNRPSFIRSVERIASRFNLAKTTGIMQQASVVPLSDYDSVNLAIPYVEQMWDRYLLEFARTQGASEGCPIKFYSNYYTYNYDSLSRSLLNHFGPFYGDYCGTRLLNAQIVFREVLSFEVRQRYGLLPDEISAPGAISFMESEWFTGEYMFWSNYETATSSLIDKHEINLKLRRDGQVSKSSISRVTARLAEAGVIVLSVKHVEGATALISCYSESQIVHEVLDGFWLVQD